jgi:hypothetical protein
MPRARKEVSEAQRNKIRDSYEQGIGMLRIGTNLGHNVGVIRRVLVELGFEIRPVGRPTKKK